MRSPKTQCCLQLYKPQGLLLSRLHTKGHHSSLRVTGIPHGNIREQNHNQGPPSTSWLGEQFTRISSVVHSVMKSVCQGIVRFWNKCLLLSGKVIGPSQAWKHRAVCSHCYHGDWCMPLNHPRVKSQNLPRLGGHAEEMHTVHRAYRLWVIAGHIVKL